MSARILPPAILLLIPLLAGCTSSDGPPATAGRVYFVVAGRLANTDSYLLPLTEPDDIAHARDLTSGQDRTGRIAVARIARGSFDGVTDNRDLLHGGRRWSWHVSEFLGFADMTIELIDGSPRLVEADLDYWLGPNMGQIGFWSYTISREARPAELRVLQ